MLAIKLQRIGKKHQPSYRLVVQEKRTKLGGPSAEDLGWWNPLQNRHEFNKERVIYWMKVGAKPTDTVWNLLVTAGIVTGKKRAVHSVKKGKGAETAASAPKEEAAGTSTA